MRNTTTFLLLFGLTLLPLTVTAQSITDLQQMSPEDRRAYFEAMSEDERTAMREKWRSEYDNLSDEEKAAMRSKRSKNRDEYRRLGRERWQSMSEEERAAAIEKRRKDGKGKRHKGKKRDAGADAAGSDQAPE